MKKNGTNWSHVELMLLKNLVKMSDAKSVSNSYILQSTCYDLQFDMLQA